MFCYLIDDGRRVLLIKNREKIEQKAKKKKNWFFTFVLVSIWMLEDGFQNIHLQGYRPFLSK